MRKKRQADTAQHTPTICMHVLGVARTDARVMREARALVEAGYAVTIVDMERDQERPAVETLDGVRLSHIFMPSRYRPTRFKPFFVVKALRMQAHGTRAVARERADSYHAHDDNALPACARAARRHRKPLVFDAHELPLSDPGITRWRFFTAVARARLRRLVPKCDAIITVSSPIASALQEWYGAKAATIVRNIPSYQPAIMSDRLRQSLGLGPETRIALYQGNLQADRSLDIVIRAARYLAPGHVIVLMGNGPARDSLMALAQSEGVADRVRIIPAVPYAELLSWTASADVGLLVVKAEYSLNVKGSLPNKLFEYLMAGVPVLTSPLDAVAELLATYDAGRVVTATDFKAIGEAISAMLTDTEGLERMRRNALAASRQHLSWEHEKLRLVGLYADLLGAPPPSVTAGAPAALEGGVAGAERSV